MSDSIEKNVIAEAIVATAISQYRQLAYWDDDFDHGTPR